MLTEVPESKDFSQNAISDCSSLPNSSTKVDIDSYSESDESNTKLTKRKAYEVCIIIVLNYIKYYKLNIVLHYNIIV